MRRTDLDAATLAAHLRGITGDGSVEWCHTPMQASVLLDIADMLDENAKLLELCGNMHRHLLNRNTLLELLHFRLTDEERAAIADIEDRMRELGVEVDA